MMLKKSRIGTLSIEVVEGKDLVAMDATGFSDPYVVVTIGKKKRKTKIIRQTLNPYWNVGDQEKFDFKIEKGTKLINVECLDWDRLNTDDRMGVVHIPFDSVKDGKMHDEWYKLAPTKQGDAVSGSLHLKIQFSDKQSEKIKAPEKPAIFVAIADKDLAKVSAILESPDVDLSYQIMEIRNTPLHEAAAIANVDIIKKLLSHPAINADAKNAMGNTPLHILAQKYAGSEGFQLVSLFADKKANVNAQNLSYETPLHKACLNPSVRTAMVECLLQKGADTTIVSKAGDLPIDYAKKLGREDTQLVLLTFAKMSLDLTAEIEKYKQNKNPDFAKKLEDAQRLYDWLKKEKLSTVFEPLVKADVTIDLLGDLTDKTLENMGIDDQNTRVKFLHAAKPVSSSPRALTRKTASVAGLGKSTDKIEKENDFVNKLSNLKHIQLTANWIIDDEDIERLNLLGKGASGSVYRAKYKGKQVAVKVLPSATDQKELTEFTKEFHILTSIKSEHAVRFYGACFKPDLSIVMEFCERGSLHDVLKNDNNKIGWDEVFHYGLSTVQAIYALHNFTPQILHRDIKSLNFLVTAANEVKVCDFGLSRFDTGSNLKTMQSLRGTFHYVAPEVYGGEKFTLRSDVYALGMILWELVQRCINKTYLCPYQEYKNLTMDFQILIAAAKRNVRPTIPASCPAPLVALITKSWSREVSDRPTTDELIAKLEELKHDYLKNKSVWDKTIV